MPKNHRLDIVATGIIVTPDRTKTLLVHHRKYDKWIPPGGHVDENEAPHEAMVRELLEETGLQANFIDMVKPFAMLTDNHIEHVPMPVVILNEHLPAYNDVPPHIHNDFIYVLECEEQDPTLKEDESHDVQWFTKGEVQQIDTFENVRQLLLAVMK